MFIRKFKDPKYSGEAAEDGDESSRSSTAANDEDDEAAAEGIYTVKSTEATETLIGHILATKIHDDLVTDASMDIPDLDEHNRVKDPKTDKRGHRNDGRTLAIHAVVVAPAYQGQSIGSIMLKDYIQRMTTLHVADRIAIIIHDRLTPFYKLQGFETVGPSKVQFSGGGWIDMVRPISDSDDDDQAF